MTGRLYSLGYEGLDVDAAVERLADVGVTTLVDVRLRASSRRPGWSKTALGAAGIAYVQEKLLGNPRENRDSFRKGDGDTGRAAMRAQLAGDSAPALARLVELAQGESIALLCVEHEPERCHRRVVTDMAHELDPSIEVVVLR